VGTGQSGLGVTVTVYGGQFTGIVDGVNMFFSSVSILDEKVHISALFARDKTHTVLVAVLIW